MWFILWPAGHRQQAHYDSMYMYYVIVCVLPTYLHVLSEVVEGAWFHWQFAGCQARGDRVVLVADLTWRQENQL